MDRVGRSLSTSIMMIRKDSGICEQTVPSCIEEVPTYLGNGVQILGAIGSRCTQHRGPRRKCRMHSLLHASGTSCSTRLVTEWVVEPILIFSPAQLFAVNDHWIQDDLNAHFIIYYICVRGVIEPMGLEAKQDRLRSSLKIHVSIGYRAIKKFERYARPSIRCHSMQYAWWAYLPLTNLCKNKVRGFQFSRAPVKALVSILSTSPSSSDILTRLYYNCCKCYPRCVGIGNICFSQESTHPEMWMKMIWLVKNNAMVSAYIYLSC